MDLWFSAYDTTENCTELYHIYVLSYRKFTSPGNAYFRPWSGLALIQTLVCCLFVAGPLTDPIMTSPCSAHGTEFCEEYQNYPIILDDIALNVFICNCAAIGSRERWIYDVCLNGHIWCVYNFECVYLFVYLYAQIYAINNSRKKISKRVWSL